MLMTETLYMVLGGAARSVVISSGRAGLKKHRTLIHFMSSSSSREVFKGLS